ncbi:hypothetical protein MD484_g5563, partial [Candolleomyces efflorescens]
MLALSTALVVASAVQYAAATIRFGCAQLVTQRLDPLVTPGQISPHVHQIVGGDAFNVTMDPNEDYSKSASCTTCRFKEDKSNYWTAVLYFKHTNGSYMRVPQKPNDQVGSTNGGMTVYYIAGYPPFQKVTAFPKGFRMISGNPMLRSKAAPSRNSVESYAISFRCWDNPRGSSNNAPPGGGQDTLTLPNKFCAGGIRSNIFFPTCWDGKTLDPPDHASHMRYQEGTVDPGMGIIWQQGTCPSSHPVRTPTVLYEIAWDTAPFRDVWPKDGSQPLVMSQGDPTGYGQHGDYVFGWEGTSLQRAMDTCKDQFGTPEACRELTVLSDAEINRCVQKAVVNERVEGEYLSALPGCNPIQNGPSPATMPANCNAGPTMPGSQPTATAPTTTVVAPTPTPTTTVVNPQPTAPQGPAVPKYGQCGGNGWTGSTACVAGSTCVKLNEWYSQCQ